MKAIYHWGNVDLELYFIEERLIFSEKKKERRKKETRER